MGMRNLKHSMQTANVRRALRSYPGPKEPGRRTISQLDSLVSDCKKYGDLTKHRTDIHPEDKAYIQKKLKEEASCCLIDTIFEMVLDKMTKK